jgi:hypothetical protein
MEIKEYRKGDETAIIQLFEQVFQKPMPLQYWEWRFQKNPTNKNMIKLMWDKEKLVGHYAVSPVVLQYRHQELLTGLSMTTMTHPAYTGLGIFQQLSESLYSAIHKEDQVAAVWGFPNNNSHRGFIKNLAWKDITTLPMLVCGTENIKAKELPEANKIKEFTDKHAAAYMSCFENYPIKIKKDKAYLNWRYFDNPSNSYTVVEIAEGNHGFVVCKEYQNGMTERKQIDIVDWCLPKDERLTKAVLQHITGMFPPPIYEQLNIWLPLTDERHVYFEKLGFFNTIPVTYWGVRSFTSDKMNNAEDWWIQLGDSDVY